MMSRWWKIRRWRARCTPPSKSTNRVPAEHYKAVAQVIGYVLRLKGKLKAN